jgi:hypothetical protein
MKIRIMLVATAIMLTALAATAMAQAPGNGPGAGGGTCYNPSAPDHDGDGIPNGLDPDYGPPRDGTGRGLRGMHVEWTGAGFWYAPQRSLLNQWGAMTARGPGRLGNGYGPGGAGDCDGSGPAGIVRRRPR